MTKRIYTADMINSALVAFAAVKSARIGYDALRPFLPYHIRKIGDKWLPMNRDYKPLGIRAGTYVDYADYAPSGIPDSLVKTPEVSLKKNSLYMDEGYLYFFSDNSTPTTSKDRGVYIERIMEAFLKKYLVTGDW